MDIDLPTGLGCTGKILPDKLIKEGTPCLNF